MTPAPTAIAVGFDGSPDAEAALRWAAALAAAIGAELRVVHAVGLLEHAGLRENVPAHEAAAVLAARDAGLGTARVRWCEVDGEPCSALQRQAEGADAVGLLVVGSRGAGAHAGTLLGSTSLELAQRATVPVVVVPSAAATP